MKAVATLIGALALVVPMAAQQPTPGGAPPAAAPAAANTPFDPPYNDAIPGGTAELSARALKESPRHQEWVDIALAGGQKLKSFVVYPERRDKAGVVLVIHDIRGMSDTARAVGDQLAQDGFIAIVPDFLSGLGPNGGGTESLGTGVGQAIRGLSRDTVNARLNAAMEYGKKLPASNGKTGVVGFCWGGASSFAFVAAQPALSAGVVFYGEAPASNEAAANPAALEAALSNVKAPVLGLYAGDDARINTTVTPTEAAMKKLGKPYEVHYFEGAGHGFVGNQAGRGGANYKAAVAAWPMAVNFFRDKLK
jgi:carboxymethylenebutenolidase